MVDNLSLPKILNITNKLKHVIHNGVGEKFCEPHVSFRQVAFVSVSYDFLESAPLPRDIRLCLCCEQHEHVSKHCTDCPRLLSFSQHARAWLFTTAYSSPSLYYLTFTVWLSPSRMPSGSGGWKRSCPVLGSASISTQYVRYDLVGAVLQLEPHARTSSVFHPLTQLSSCQNNRNVKQIAKHVLWSGTIIDRVVSVEIRGLFLELLRLRQVNNRQR